MTEDFRCAFGLIDFKVEMTCLQNGVSMLYTHGENLLLRLILHLIGFLLWSVALLPIM